MSHKNWISAPKPSYSEVYFFLQIAFSHGLRTEDSKKITNLSAQMIERYVAGQ